MQFEFHANACCSYTAKGKTLMCDPWLVDGAFYGAWYHYPPPNLTPEGAAEKADYLYISHLHPDHYDPKTLKAFPRDVPLICLDHGPNFFIKMLKRDGFTNLIPMKDKEVKKVGPFTVTMFAPFVKHPFVPSDVGNLIDSSIIVDDGTARYLNTNDNMPNIEAAKWLGKEYGSFDVAQLNFNAAGMYPACYMGLPVEQRLEASHRIVLRNLNHLADIYEHLNAKRIMPFAGEYILGGRNWRKNWYLGTITASEAHDWLKSMGVPTAHSQLRVGMIERMEYARDSLSKLPYSYDDYEPFVVSRQHIRKATANLRAAARRFGREIDKSIVVNDFQLTEGPNGSISFEMDPKLFAGILAKDFHWNNAEIGCHIEFDRHPDTYDPDIHTLMSFLHL